jgi:hypothetical protein
VNAERRDYLNRELAQVTRHVADGQAHIAKQVRIIDGLHRDGRDSTSAREFLHLLHDTQHLHEDHREHILRELDA